METKQVWTKRIIYIGFIIMLVWKISVSCEKKKWRNNKMNTNKRREIRRCLQKYLDSAS